MIKFDLQLFGGKGSSTTTENNYRPLTDDEKSMQHDSMLYAKSIQPTASSMVDQANKGFAQASKLDPNYGQLYNAQSNATAQNTVNANNIANGLLPTSFADNRNAQAKQYATASVGGLLNDLNQRNVINGTTMTNGLHDIDTTMANAFTNSFNNDLNTASNLNNQAQSFANMPIQQANQAQQASYQTPLQLYGAGTGQMQPTQQIWQPTLLSNQSNPTSSTSSTSGGGGLFSGLVSGLGSYYGAACFIAGTKISTPNGDKKIENVKVGDEVYSHNGTIETVTYVMSPIISADDYLTIESEYGSAVTTTSTQEFITTDGDIHAPNLVGETCICEFGEEIIDKITPAKKELVYDLSTTGSNTYFANCFLVKGANNV